jgi:hypothetical protein
VASQRHDREFWERARHEIERGGKLGAVAQRLGVRPRTLSWWIWRLRRERPSKERRSRAEFLPVVINDQPTAATPLVELEADGLRLRFEAGTDAEYVSTLVNALRSRC